MRARRGDLVVLQFTRRTPVTGAEYVEFEVHHVTSITRDGMVKATRRVDSTIALPLGRNLADSNLLVIPAALADVAGIAADVAEHTWPGSTLTRPFDSLDEIKVIVRRHRTADPARQP